MDILTQAVADTATIHVKSAAGEPLYDGDKPVQITIFGPGSKQFGTVEARQSSRAVKRMQDNDGKITVATHEERLAETAEDLAAITVRFDNLSLGDKQGSELFEAVYRNPSLGFIAKQVSKAVADWGNFKPGSAGA